MKQVTTTDLAAFGCIERDELRDILNVWNDHGLPEDFDIDGVVPMLNKDSGCVFLTNSEFQCAMLTDEGKLESWYNCGNCGHEGFKEDCQLNEEDQNCNECCACDEESCKNA